MQNSNQEIPKKAIKGYKLKGKSGIINLGNDKLKAKSLMSNKHLHQHHTLKTTYDKWLHPTKNGSLGMSSDDKIC